MGTWGGLWGPMGTFGDPLAPMGTYGDLSGPMGSYGVGGINFLHTHLDTNPPPPSSKHQIYIRRITHLVVYTAKTTCHMQGVGGKKIRANFFLYPPPPPGVPPEKKAGTPCRNFFLPGGIFYCVLLELAWHLHFATLYDIGT